MSGQLRMCGVSGPARGAGLLIHCSRECLMFWTIWIVPCRTWRWTRFYRALRLDFDLRTVNFAQFARSLPYSLFIDMLNGLTLSLLLSQCNKLHKLVKRNTIIGCRRQPTEPPARYAEKGEIVAEFVGAWIAEDVKQENAAGHDWYLDNLPVRWT